MKKLRPLGSVAAVLAAAALTGCLMVVAQGVPRPTETSPTRRPRLPPGQPSDAAARQRPPHGPPPPPPPLMRALDVDRDGELSAGEIGNAATALLRLDEDGDGILKGGELHPPWALPHGHGGPPPWDHGEAAVGDESRGHR